MVDYAILFNIATENNSLMFDVRDLFLQCMVLELLSDKTQYFEINWLKQ